MKTEKEIKIELRRLMKLKNRIENTQPYDSSLFLQTRDTILALKWVIDE